MARYYLALGIFAVGCLASASRADSTLYMSENQGTFHILDQTTGMSALVGPLGTGRGTKSLAAVPGERSFVYGLHVPSVGTALSRIDLQTGMATVMPFFDEGILGFPEPFSLGLAISPANPTVGIVSGFNGRVGDPNFGDDYLWEVDLATGAALGPAIPDTNTCSIDRLAYNLDGSTLYGTDSCGQLITVDPNTAQATVIGDPGLSNFFVGLSFRPEDGTLFAIHGFGSDELVILDPNDGSVISTLGPVGFFGPEGLAFVQNVIAGDFDENGVHDCADADALVAEIVAGTNNLIFDLTSDNLVNQDDLDEWLILGGAANPNLTGGNPFLPGDVNLDGAVDAQDFIDWNNNKFTQNATWCAGDMNADGFVDAQDFQIWNANKFTSSNVFAVPEPATVWGLGGLAIWVMAQLRRN